MRKLRKVKKANGQILATNEVIFFSTMIRTSQIGIIIAL